MKVNLVNENFYSDYLANLLYARGVENVEDFLQPTDEYLFSPELLDNVAQGALWLEETLNKENSKILIVVDCDVDGFTSAAIIWNYIQALAPEQKIYFLLHEHKQHGLEDCCQMILDGEVDYDLIILPDSSSNDFEYHELLGERGMRCLVLDHHEVDNRIFSEYACIINNQLSEHYPNKDLTGADGTAFREQYGIGDDFIVMYSGAHGPANDLETALNAAEILRDHKNIRFVFVGSGKDKERLETLAAEKNLTNVLFVPPVPKEQIASVMAAENAGLAILKKLDMFKTTYPNKVFDIMACGDPVICQIDGVIREVVEENKAGVFAEPGDPQSLADAVLKLAGDPEGCRRMGENGQRIIREKFSRDSAEEQLEQIFMDLSKK